MSDLDKLFDKSNIPESNWFKFQKVGDKIGGVIVDVYDVERKGDFAAQRVFELRTPSGEEVNVGVNIERAYLNSATKRARPGDLAGFEFVKEIPATKKGYAPAKSITPYITYTEEGNAVREFEKSNTAPSA